MRYSGSVRYALVVYVCGVMLSGCGGSQSPIGAPGAIPQAPARTMMHHIGTAWSSYRVLYNFRKGTDGAYPEASLLNVSGTLYGTTAGGGAFGRGTVFSISKSGSEMVLHSFGKGTDGAYPDGGLINVSGALYGTTEFGGAYGGTLGDGNVYSIDKSGVENVLHNFGKSTDGANPQGCLIDVDGTLYGTTTSGGAYGRESGGIGFGTVFSISTSGAEKVIHSFGHGRDGEEPLAGLVDLDGTLYGTTYMGGCVRGHCFGTVFSTSTSGTEKVLHTFGRVPEGVDGAAPMASLIAVGTLLYGTTGQGGGYQGDGTVFRTKTNGKGRILHSFGHGSDGSQPRAGLVNVNGTLYGTTFYGGAYHGYGFNAGTVFSITATGSEKVLHRFGKGTDGYNPSASLINVNGTLYGTTTAGGKYGEGTVFALTP